MGRCFGSELIAKPKRMSWMIGMPTMIPNVTRSRRIWMNSLTTIAQNRAGENLRPFIVVTLSPDGPMR